VADEQKIKGANDDPKQESWSSFVLYNGKMEMVGLNLAFA